jgi:hypothetical protein
MKMEQDFYFDANGSMFKLLKLFLGNDAFYKLSDYLYDRSGCKI